MRSVSRSEALQIATQILTEAEQERSDAAEREAAIGIQIEAPVVAEESNDMRIPKSRMKQIYRRRERRRLHRQLAKILRENK